MLHPADMPCVAPLPLQALQAAISALHTRPGAGEVAVLAFGRILVGLARRAAAWSELEAVLDSAPLHQVIGGGAAAPGLAAGCSTRASCRLYNTVACLAVLLYPYSISAASMKA
jgi:hypothetical protein